MQDSWALTFRGPWSKTWTETKGGVTTTLTEGSEKMKVTIDLIRKLKARAICSEHSEIQEAELLTRLEAALLALDEDGDLHRMLGLD